MQTSPFYRYLHGAKLQGECWPFNLNRVRERLGLEPIDEGAPSDSGDTEVGEDSPAEDWKPPDDLGEWRGRPDEDLDGEPELPIADGALETRAALPSGGGDLECTFLGPSSSRSDREITNLVANSSLSQTPLTGDRLKQIFETLVRDLSLIHI